MGCHSWQLYNRDTDRHLQFAVPCHNKSPKTDLATSNFPCFFPPKPIKNLIVPWIFPMCWGRKDGIPYLVHSAQISSKFISFFLNLTNIFSGIPEFPDAINPSFLLVNQPPWIKIPFMLPTVAVIPVTLGSKVAWFWGEWFFPTFNRESLLNGLI